MPIFNSSIANRIKFEKKNKKDCKSFKEDKTKADYAFEVSSEGELEQVKAIIEKLLNNHLKVELIYCSESVEKQCEALSSRYSKNLRTLRLPLILFKPFGKFFVGNWLTAKTFFFCRYDFFPELVFYGKKQNVEMILLSGTMKNFTRKTSNFISKWYYNYVYKSFDKVVMSTDLDKELVEKQFNISQEIVESYDFRPIQIYKRIRNKLEHLHTHFVNYSKFSEYIEGFDKSKRVIFGSYWNDEKVITSEIVTLINKGFQLTIVPHRLDEQNIEQIKETLNKIAPSIEIYEINSLMKHSQVDMIIKDMKSKNGILILNLKGILCELYTLYGHAYVAGGFRLSVHSLMEPYLAECMIYCGSKIHRSTEYDLITQSNPDRIKLIENEKSLLKEILNTNIETLSSMGSFQNHYEGHFAPLLIWLGIETDWGISNA